jgi:hypothetical protein
MIHDFSFLKKEAFLVVEAYLAAAALSSDHFSALATSKLKTSRTGINTAMYFRRGPQKMTQNHSLVLCTLEINSQKPCPNLTLRTFITVGVLHRRWQLARIPVLTKNSKDVGAARMIEEGVYKGKDLLRLPTIERKGIYKDRDLLRPLPVTRVF